MAPQDPQGVHKAAAEFHFRNYAALDGFHVVSLRLPNCFGEGQPVTGEDIGLVGGFIRTLCQGGTVTVYGEGRRRAMLYARDAAEIVERVAGRRVTGFVPLNVAGRDVDIRELAERLRALVGAGAVADATMPPEIAAIEPGAATIDDRRLRAVIGEPPESDLDDALRRTVGYFTERLA
jgi:nucleoside-diphosphate-sugar epimerase